MRFVFFGTDDFSVIVLDELKRAGFLPSLIITTPDKPKGRGLMLTPPLVKIWAQENKISLFQPKKLDSINSILLASKIVEYCIVASYGKVIPKAILDTPKYGALNVHPSLLPKYRGPSPIESQILASEKEIGVTIMQMDEKMDHGPIVAQRKTKFHPAPDVDGLQTSSAEVLRRMLAETGGQLLAETIPKWIAGEIKAVPQDESKATYTKKFTKNDGEIKLGDDAYQNFLKVRAFDSTIGTYFFAEKIRVKITDADFRDGKLIIRRVIPEGKKEMSYEAFLRGVKS